jgi:subtilisin family serine protease
VYLNKRSGRGVRVAVVDSGVHAAHPHVGRADAGIGIRENGELDPDTVDYLGHGTAVAAAILEKAPEATILPIKVFWRTLSTGASPLVLAIDEACSRGARVINLSLGTPNAKHRPMLEAAVSRARSAGAVIVSALRGDDDGLEWLPGCLAGVVAVRLDWGCPRDEYRIDRSSGSTIIVASGYPRDRPGVPRERNLKGVSFAVANATGFVARACEALPRADADVLLGLLAAERDRCEQDIGTG